MSSKEFGAIGTRLRQSILIGNIGEENDMAEAALFLESDRSE